MCNRIEPHLMIKHPVAQQKAGEVEELVQLFLKFVVVRITMPDAGSVFKFGQVAFNGWFKFASEYLLFVKSGVVLIPVPDACSVAKQNVK